MKLLQLSPDNIIVQGLPEISNEDVLKIYFRIFNKGYGRLLPPVIVADNSISVSDFKAFQEALSDYKQESAALNHRKKGLDEFVANCETISAGGHTLYLIKKEQVHSVYSVQYRYSHQYGEFFVHNDIVAEQRRIENEAKQIAAVFKREIEEIVNIAKKAKKYRGQNASYILLDGNHKCVAATLTHQPISALNVENGEDLGTIKEMVERGELFNFYRTEDSLSDVVVKFFQDCVGEDYDFVTARQRVDKLVSDKFLPKYMIERYTKSTK